MIDLVFVKKLSLPITIDVKDTYYSDHDIVFLTINPIQNVTKRLAVSANKKNNPTTVDALQLSTRVKERIVNVQLPIHNNTVCSQFRFFQVDKEWQTQMCSSLGLQYCSTYNRP